MTSGREGDRSRSPTRAFRMQPLNESSFMKHKASAIWKGSLKEGSGTLSTGSGALSGKPYSFRTRFEGEPGTNPEELIGAAHAGCFSMAFSMILGLAGHTPE